MENKTNTQTVLHYVVKKKFLFTPVIYGDVYMRENTLARRLRVDSHGRTCVRMHLSGRPPPHCGGNSLLLIDCRDPGNPPRPHNRRVSSVKLTPSPPRTPVCTVRFSHGFAPPPKSCVIIVVMRRPTMVRAAVVVTR